MIVRVWGARGSLAAPGPATVAYGGNTSCVELELADGSTLILDAGSGIRELGQRLVARDRGVLHICLTHLHLDHVEGLGFFAPLWKAGWKLRFWGPPSTTATLQERVARYLSPPLFPIGLSEAPAEAVFEDVPRESWRVGSAVIEAQMVEHRGPTLGYRIEDEGRVIAYLPDHEPYLTAAPDDRPEWISGWALAAGADLLLHDSQYTAGEYEERLGFGHSSANHAAAFARAAGVSRLGLFHHDPMRSDRALEALYDEVAELLRNDQEPPLIAREGSEIDLGADTAS
ncbi:MAG TPA: MBL fold metallo-hydrolase [Gaiellaceae bacterium]|nr:MBL fold metallo-hydrolase [Gaiellaceae bacterium]